MRSLVAKNAKKIIIYDNFFSTRSADIFALKSAMKAVFWKQDVENFLKIHILILKSRTTLPGFMRNIQKSYCQETAFTFQASSNKTKSKRSPLYSILPEDPTLPRLSSC